MKAIAFTVLLVPVLVVSVFSPATATEEVRKCPAATGEVDPKDIIGYWNGKAAITSESFNSFYYKVTIERVEDRAGEMKVFAFIITPNLYPGVRAVGTLRGNVLSFWWSRVCLTITGDRMHGEGYGYWPHTIELLKWK